MKGQGWRGQGGSGVILLGNQSSGVGSTAGVVCGYTSGFSQLNDVFSIGGCFLLAQFFGVSPPSDGSVDLRVGIWGHVILRRYDRRQPALYDRRQPAL